MGSEDGLTNRTLSAEAGDAEVTVADDPAVAVILPTLNGAPFIGEQLSALINQSASFPWHIVVVDGGSTDATLSVVERFSISDIPIRVVRLRGAPGVNAGLNAGVRATSSSVILIAEHDDVVAEGWLQQLTMALGEHSLVGSRIDKKLLNDTVLIGSRRRFAEDVERRVQIVDCTGMGFRRSLWSELGGFDETYTYGGNDAEFCFRACDHGHPVTIVDSAIVHYRIRPDAKSAYRQARSYGIATVRLFREFGPAYVARRRGGRVLKELVRLVWWAPRALVNDSYRMAFAYRGGLQLGYLIGSLRFRRWFI